MQPQYSQGAAPSHHPPPYAPPEVSQANGGSITSSLRQWRKKDYLEKQQSTEQPQTSVSVAENPSHVARVAPHTYYPRLTNDVCHYQHQYSEYGGPYKPPAPTPVKYSEIVDNPQAQTIEHITPVIPKLKDKEFGDLCSVAPQPHLKQYQDQMTMKQSYPDGTKQTYSDPTVHHQYISKESQIHPFLQKQSQMHQYIQKEPYQQFLPKYGMQGQYPQSYSSEPNNFLAHLNKINPRMAQSIINDTHLRDPQIPMYHSLEQNRSYPQPQRMYHAPSIHSSPTHAHRNMPQSYNYPQPYNYNIKSSMQPSDPYNRVHQYQHNVPKYLPEYKMNASIEQPIPNISPQRMYNESVMNYAPMPPKISPNYPHCSQLEYAQHYQHRRAHLAQEYYSHPGYKSGYVQNPQVSPEGGISDARARKSSLKQYLETWVEEDMSGNLPDLVVSSNNLNDVENMENLKGTMCIKGSGTQEQPLYVLDTTEIPNETLPHFLHLQQFEKLPDNIRGYYHSTSAMPPGSRRIIIDNNSSEGLPENSQVIRGNSAPIVPKISEGFAENGNVVENESAAQNQRKIITSEETPPGLENQIQNLENKVVQIHIIEDSEATTNSGNLSSDITTDSPSDTVIIQSNMYQDNAPHTDPFTKIIENDESCVIEKHQVEEETHPSTSSEDSLINMPAIDEFAGETTESETATEEIFFPPKDMTSNHNSVQEDQTEEEIPEDLQTCEDVNSRRSSICSIYKEMEHIHGENSSTSESNKSKTPENIPSKSDPSQTVSEENIQENCENVCSSNSSSINNGKTNDSDEPRSCVDSVEQNKFEELNAKDKHSKLENCDASKVNPTDLTNSTNPEIPGASKDKVESLETDTANVVVQETVLENENHRQISKKLRTAKVTTPNIAEECSPDGKNTAVQELLTNKIKNSPEFVEEIKNPNIVEDVAEPFEAAPYIKDNFLLNTKETNCTEGGNAIKTILQIPNAKFSAINCQNSDENVMLTKENCLNEDKLPESSEETHILDEINHSKDLPPLPLVEDIQISDNDNKETSQSLNTNLEITCHQIEDFIYAEKNAGTVHTPHNENIIKATPSNSKESTNKTTSIQKGEDCLELENVKKTEQTYIIESIRQTNITTDIAEIEYTENSAETFKNTKENHISTELYADEAENDMQTIKPLNLSVDKKCIDNTPNVYETQVSPLLHKEAENKCVLDYIDDPVNSNVEISEPENLSLSVGNPKKLDVLETSDTSNAKFSTKRVETKSTSRKKKTNRLAKLKMPQRRKESLKSKNLVVSKKSKRQVDVQTTKASSDTTAIESKEEKPTKCTNLNEDTSKLVNTTEAKSAPVEEECSKSRSVDTLTNNSNEKVEMPELVAVSDTKSKFEDKPIKIQEISRSANCSTVMNWPDMNDASSINSNIQSSETTMPILKCMVNYEELESSNVDINMKDTLKSTNKIKKNDAPKPKNAKNKMESSCGVSEMETPQKKPPRTSKNNKGREKKYQRESDLRRKSRRLNKDAFAINMESKEEQTPMPHLVKENILQVAEVVIENPRDIYDAEENTVLDNNSFENSHTIEEETNLQQSAALEVEENVETTHIPETKKLEKTKTIKNSDENIEQNIPSEENSCYSGESSNIPAEDKPEEDFLKETEPTVSTQEEDFENNSIVYQINDNNVVLQIADELLEINVTTQNGRKIISVKTFSDAIIMNTSEEASQGIEDTFTTEYEDSNSNIEIQDEKLCENEAPLNNNYIDDISNTSNLKNTGPNVEDEGNFCFKEICTATDITTVGDDVFIYNEEVVSSSTEIEAVSKLPNSKEEQTETVTADNNLQRKYVTRKSSKRDKKVSWEDEKCNLDKTKCLSQGSQKKSQKDELVKPKVQPEPTNKKSTTIKDSLRKSPKTKAALKFVETVKTSKPKVKESKVPSKATDNAKTHPKVEADNPTEPDKNATKLINKPPVEHTKEENVNVKNVPRQKYHAANKIESHSNKNKNEEKTDEAQKIKEKIPNKDSEKVHLKTKRSLSPKEEKPHHNNKTSKISQAPKKKPKIDKTNEEPPKTAKIQTENRKIQKQKATEEISIKGTKEKVKKNPTEIIENTKTHKEVQNKKTKSKSSEEQPKTRSKQKTEDKVANSVQIEEPPLEENQISVQENSITSSTCQETEASIRQRSSKLIQQITDDWDDDSDDLKATENSCKRRLSLQEYNSRKRTNSIAEPETTPSLELNKPDLTDNLFSSGNVLIGNKIKREISPESPILSVKFNNKTYSRSSVYALKPNAILNTSDHEPDIIPKEASNVVDYKKEEPLSSAIELHLPRINRSPRPAYNQEYLRNALMHDLQAVNAYTTTLIKENQQLMQRFLEQKRLTADELKKVKTIIRYKRLVQHLSTIRINEMQTTSVRGEVHATKPDTDSILYPSTNFSWNPAAHLKLTKFTDNCDVNRRQSDVNQIVNASENSKISQLHSEEHVKLTIEKRKKKRFRFLYSDEETESHSSSSLGGGPTALISGDSNLKRPRLDNSVPGIDSKVMDYSVHQSNSQGQLTLVFKRSFKSDPKMQPFVRLERLPSIDLLAKNRLY